MINPPPITGLIAQLEECLGKLDASGELLAGAHLSSAIDSLRASLVPDRTVVNQCKPGTFTVH